MLFGAKQPLVPRATIAWNSIPVARWWKRGQVAKGRCITSLRRRHVCVRSGSMSESLRRLHNIRVDKRGSRFSPNELQTQTVKIYTSLTPIDQNSPVSMTSSSKHVQNGRDPCPRGSPGIHDFRSSPHHPPQPGDGHRETFPVTRRIG